MLCPASPAPSGLLLAQFISLAAGLASEQVHYLSAEAILQALQISETESKMFAVSSKEGSGPGQDKESWQQLFSGT